MTKTFFTSDHHFGHSKIIEYCNRPFKNKTNMDIIMIQKWNSVVGPHDIVYHLGDFTLGDIATLRTYISMLNGVIKIIPGGHDRWVNEYHTVGIIWSDSSRSISLLKPLETVKINKKIFVLCHYAMKVWDRSHYGSYHLFGHSHGNLVGEKNSMDVGVDTNDFYPYSLEQVVEKLGE